MLYFNYVLKNIHNTVSIWNAEARNIQRNMIFLTNTRFNQFARHLSIVFFLYPDGSFSFEILVTGKRKSPAHL